MDRTVKKTFSGVMAFVSTGPRYPLRPDDGSDPSPGVVSSVVSSVTAAQVPSRRLARAGRLVRSPEGSSGPGSAAGTARGSTATLGTGSRGASAGGPVSL